MHATNECGTDGRGRRRRGAFTLLELLLAVAIMSLLILGIHHVFRATASAVGTGQAVVGAARESRAGYATLYNDARNALVSEDPFLLIHSQRQAAYLNEADDGADDDRNVNTADTGENLVEQPALAHYRNCRTDLLGMFVRDFERKQTGSGNTMISPLSTMDAYVVYGHLRLRNQAGAAYFDPGLGDALTNTNNYYSSAWILGRRALLLSDVTVDLDNIDQVCVDTTGAGPLLVGYGASCSREPNNAYKQLQSGRHDLVRTTVADLLTIARQHDSVANAKWWESLVYRFQADPTPMLPITSDSAALSTPIFLRNCRQFLVEFAGDFVTQERDIVNAKGGTKPDGVTTHDINHANYGRITKLEPDGRLDFHLVPSGQGTEKLERIRFYGFPREVDGRPGIAGTGGVNQMTDVVPFRDVARSYDGSFSGAHWERVLPDAAADYDRPNALRPDAAYTCVFGPGDPRPKLVRIIITLEDPSGRVGASMSHEYVIQLGR